MCAPPTAPPLWQRAVQMPAGAARLHGTVQMSAGASGSRRFSPRYPDGAGVLCDAGLGPWLFEGLTPAEATRCARIAW